jgi:CubicO group peptidase (beta-lactamase class C family)
MNEKIRSPEQQNESWFQYIEKGREFVDENIAPGISISAFEKGRWANKNYGVLDEKGSQVSPDTYYDIASVTKVFTALIWLKEMNTFGLNLDSKANDCVRWFSHFPNLQLKHLLAHQNSIEIKNRFNKEGTFTRPKIQEYFENPQNLTQILKNKNIPNEYNYKDTSYLLLAREMEERMGKSFDVIFEDFCRKFDLHSIHFNPLEKSIDPSLIAPSSSALHHGVPFDPKNRFYGGVSGHSGLFATNRGLTNFVEKIIQNEFELPRQIFDHLFYPQSTASQDTGLAFSIGGWRTGFLAKTQQLPNISGYTGPLIVLDPKNQKAMIATTNITYPENTDHIRAKYRLKLNELIP